MDISNRPSLDYEDRTLTLAGIDKNKNGIRDDVERFVNESLNGYSENIVNVHLSYARTLQKIIVLDQDNQKGKQELSQEVSNKISCRGFLVHSLPPSERSKIRKVQIAFSKLSANTLQRRKARKANSLHDYGTHVTDSFLFTHMDEVCGFVIKDYTLTIAKTYKMGGHNTRSLTFMLDEIIKEYPDKFTTRIKNEILRDFAKIPNRR